MPLDTAQWRAAVKDAFPWWRQGPFLDEPFPITEGNSVLPLPKQEELFETMLDAIRGAAQSVDVEMYLWEDDDLGRAFATALADAADRGASVRVLVDSYGAREVVGQVLDTVRDAGGRVRVFNPFRITFLRRYFHRTHKKLLVIDGVRAFCGGVGFSRHFALVKHKERPWHDRMFDCRGPVVAQLLRTFEIDFARWPSGSRLIGPLHSPTPPPAAGTARVRVLRSWPDARDIHRFVQARTGHTKERLWIGTPYLIPPRVLRRALRNAARRGVDVRIVVPAREGANWALWFAARRRYASLLRAGVRIFEYGPRFYHAKLAVADDDVALVGSSNMDNISWRRNAELDLLLLDAESVEVIAQCYLRDEAAAEEVGLKTFGARGLWHRFLERLVGLLDQWM